MWQISDTQEKRVGVEDFAKVNSRASATQAVTWKWRRVARRAKDPDHCEDRSSRSLRDNGLLSPCCHISIWNPPRTTNRNRHKIAALHHLCHTCNLPFSIQHCWVVCHYILMLTVAFTGALVFLLRFLYLCAHLIWFLASGAHCSPRKPQHTDSLFITYSK